MLGHRVIVPETLRLKLLKELHASHKQDKKYCTELCLVAEYRNQHRKHGEKL